MPAMYPERLRELREQNPGLQYDFRGNLIDGGGYGDELARQFYDAIYKPGYDASQPSWNQLYQNYGPSNGDALSRIVQGLDGYNYQNDQFVGPVLPGQQQGYAYSDYDQAGPLQPGVSNLSLPNVGFYSQWNPDTNSWTRHGFASDGLGMGTSRSRGDARPSYGAPASPRQRGFAPAGLEYEQQAPAGINLSERSARPYGSNADELWPRIQADPGYNPQSSPRGWN